MTCLDVAVIDAAPEFKKSRAIKKPGSNRAFIIF
jgi:hypothetical protein